MYIAAVKQVGLDDMGSDSSNREYSLAVDTPDEVLVEAAKAGQIEALREIYRRYARLVYTLALRILGNAEEAEDVTQEIFLTLWHRQHYDPKRGSLQRFLVVLTRSRSIDRVRSHNSRHRFLQRWRTLNRDVAAENAPFEHATLDEQSQRVREALAGLPAAERKVLEIAYYGGLSQSEVATELGIPLGTVKTRSRQGLKKLRRALSDFL